MKLVYQCMTIFFTFSPISNPLLPLRLVVGEDDNVKSGYKRYVTESKFLPTSRLFSLL